jgi:hypothetical protein
MPQKHLKPKKQEFKKKSAANKHGKGGAVTKKGANLMCSRPESHRTVHLKLSIIQVPNSLLPKGPVR